MRSEGQSVRTIAQQLGVARSSVSVWVRDIVLTEAQVAALTANQHLYAAQNKGSQANREKYRALRRQYQTEGWQRAQMYDPLHLAGCMLYWAEGAKYRNRLYFTNSDSNMHSLFMRFLRESMSVRDSEIAIYLHCHVQEPDAITSLEDYWLRVLNLTRQNLRRSYVKQGSQIQRSILAYGVCSVNVNRVDLVQHIFGAIQAYGQFENPAWLG